MAKKKKDKSDKKSDAKRKGKKSDKKRDVKSAVKSKDKKKDKKKDKAGKKAKASSKKADPGASVKDAELYETLRADGNSQKKSARIANAAAASSREDVAERGGSAPAYDEWTRAALYDRAKDVGLPGRSTMNKQELVDALRDS
ncbi:MAG: hypothetical protein K0Q93_1644 [Nocardioidaceae bacterium]|jgi:hypothetical protein|nr:hypothetical protein [Nocardioidaceae bacterium]